jgi:scavenger receptor class B protein 1
LNTWSNPPVFIYRKYYLFSVKNPTEVQKGLEKPHLIEYGPYVYREILEKKNLHFTDDDKLTYYPVSTLYFEPSLSNGSESDLITFVNIPAVVNRKKILFSFEFIEFD